MAERTVAALYVEENGIYSDFPGVDPWPESRDARAYSGPHPVVAHPPCERWGRYWYGGPSVNVRKHKGDDRGCFASALFAARTFGGVIEHPEASSAWAWFGLQTPPKKGGWVEADSFGGVTCCVYQRQYGHRADKATWLYLVGHDAPPALAWGKPEGRGLRLDAGYHSAEERAAAARETPIERMGKRERLATPRPFAELLVKMARECQRPR